MSKIGFIGLGNMGLPMSIGLMNSGYEVIGYDVNEERSLLFKKSGGNITLSCANLVAESDVILTSLPSNKAVEAVYLDKGGLLDHCNSSQVVIDTSTVAPELNQQLEASLSEKSIPFLAAPVSGGVVGAENQTLTVMVGGKEEAFQKVEDILNVIGGNVFHVGEQIDKGTTVKLINNLLIGFYTAGVSEALQIANQKDIDLNDLFSMMNVSYGQSRIYERNYKTFIEPNDFNPGFALKLLRKDLEFAMEVADNNQIDLPISKSLLDLYRNLEQQGYGDQDMAVLYKYLKDTIDQNKEATT